MAARITIGIPFYNCESTLAETIRSVYAQSFQDWQMILLDDGSTDNSLAIAESLRDARVMVISDGVNKGIGARRQQIVELTESEYLAWQDADDLMHPERLAIQLAYMEKHLDLDLVDNWNYVIGPKDEVIGLSRLPSISGDIVQIIKEPLMLNGSSLGRMEMYRKNGFDLSFRRCEDWEMWIRASENSKFGRIAEPLYFRRSVGSLGQIPWKKELRELAIIRKTISRHGPRLVGWYRTLCIIATWYMHISLRASFCILGIQGLLPWTQRQKVTNEEKKIAEAILSQIAGTCVPGLDGSPAN